MKAGKHFWWSHYDKPTGSTHYFLCLTPYSVERKVQFDEQQVAAKLDGRFHFSILVQDRVHQLDRLLGLLLQGKKNSLRFKPMLRPLTILYMRIDLESDIDLFLSLGL